MRSMPFTACLVLLTSGSLGAAELLPGLIGEYYSHTTNLEDFPTIAPGTVPTVRRADRNIAWESMDEAWPKTSLTEHFSVTWSGFLRVPASGSYTLTLESDDGSRLRIDYTQVIDNGGTHGMEEKSGTLALTAGDHPLVIDYYQGEGSKGCKLFWATAGSEKTIIPAEALFHSADLLPSPVASAPLPAAERVPGLRADIFTVDSQDDGAVPTLAPDAKPTVSRIDAQVDVSIGDQPWPGTSLSDHLYIRWTGVLRVPVTGTYQFTTDSDDGSWLTVGGVEVVENAGFHPMQEASGAILLQAGDHPLRLDYRESEGEAGCRLLWTIPGGAKEVIPAASLFHAAP